MTIIPDDQEVHEQPLYPGSESVFRRFGSPAAAAPVTMMSSPEGESWISWRSATHLSVADAQAMVYQLQAAISFAEALAKVAKSTEATTGEIT